MLAQLGLKVVPALIIPKLFGKLRVAFRIGLLLDALHSDVVADRLSREALLAKVRRILHLELQLLAGLRSTQRIVERSQRVLSANLDQYFFAGNRLAVGNIRDAVLRHGLCEILHLATKLDLCTVAVYQRTVLL